MNKQKPQQNWDRVAKILDKYAIYSKDGATISDLRDIEHFLRKHLELIATKSADKAVLDYILSLGWQDTENEYVKEVLDDAEEIAKSLSKPKDL